LALRKSFNANDLTFQTVEDGLELPGFSLERMRLPILEPSLEAA
jgi:hypothetical protein